MSAPASTACRTHDRHLLAGRPRRRHASSSRRRSTRSGSRRPRVGRDARGVYWHALGDTPGRRGPRVRAESELSARRRGRRCRRTSAYKNIVNDVGVDPKKPNHISPRSAGAAATATTASTSRPTAAATWAKINPAGAHRPEGHRLRDLRDTRRRQQAVRDQPVAEAAEQGVGRPRTTPARRHLRLGQRDSPGRGTRSPTRTSSPTQGSALEAVAGGQGVRPRRAGLVQPVARRRPGEPEPVSSGLEEVYETSNGGSNWNTVGPYWNFYFSCWAPDALYPPNGDRTVPAGDAHRPALRWRSARSTARPTLFVGNDGGIYRRPLNGHDQLERQRDRLAEPERRHDRRAAVLLRRRRHSADHGDRADRRPASGVLVSGGLQDNGGSLLRPGAAKMSSNFGGDGGDVLVDPNDGCNIVAGVRRPDDGGHPDLRLPARTRSVRRPVEVDDVQIAPPDINARFIAPFAAETRTSTTGSPAATTSGSRRRASPSARAPSGRRSRLRHAGSGHDCARLFRRQGDRGLVWPVQQRRTSPVARPSAR